MSRHVVQPGPVHPRRIDSFCAAATPLRFALQPGLSLNEAVTRALVEAGFQGATLSFTGAGLNPFRYVIPGPPDGPDHVAYFSAPRAPSGETRIEQANATFGWSDGNPFLHCHAAWIEPDGSRRGGHILPRDTIVSYPAEVLAWGFDAVRIETMADPETNFTIFQPTAAEDAPLRGGGDRLPVVVARIKPNEDVIGAVEEAARRHGLRNAVVRGSLGSLAGTSFADGRVVADLATEVLVRNGRVRDGQAEVDLLAVDMQGEVHDGWLARGENPVLITFDLVLEGTPAHG
jgi:predicted DNA-binding protein with PD1-like motif